MTRFQVGVVASAVAVVFTLGACTSQSEIESLVTWGDAHVAIAGSLGDAPAELTLRDDGTASLTEFPQGTSREVDPGNVCLDLSTDERYTGEGTWVALGPHVVVVKFAASEVHLSVSERWSDIVIDQCDEPTTWWLSPQ